MKRHGKLEITEERKNYIEKYWGPIEALGNDDAMEIAQEYIADEITDAEFEDDETIRYEYEIEDEDEDEDYENEPYPAFTPEYLRHIGMSMSDFI